MKDYSRRWPTNSSICCNYTFLAFLFLLSSSTIVDAQKAPYNNGFQAEYFFGNQVNPRTEAMGKASVAFGNTLFDQFQNPAALGNIDKREIALSTSAPFYVLSNSNYIYSGYAQRILPKLVVGAVLNQFYTGSTTFGTDIGNKRYDDLDRPKSINTALTAAYELIEGLVIGVNFNFYQLTIFREIPTAKTAFLDAGLQYSREIKSDSKVKQFVKLGAGIMNATASELTFKSPDDEQSTNVLPTTGRFGIAYQRNGDISIPKAGTGSFDFIFTVEHQNVFNTEVRRTFQMGAEAFFWKVLAVRAGFIHETNDDGGLPEYNRDKASAPTYGFGTVIPVSKMGKKKVPFDVHFDYTTIQPLDFSILFGRPTNVRTFAVRLVWIKTDKK